MYKENPFLKTPGSGFNKRTCFFLLVNTLFSTVFFAQLVVRGPYLQQSSPNSIIIHWRTSDTCDAKVWYGQNFGVMTDSVMDTLKGTEHIVKLSGLNVYSKYYYNIGTGTMAFYPQQTNFYFYTHPPENAEAHYRFWVTGDAGWGNNNQRIVRDAFLYYNSGKKLDGWLWLGDNAYFTGLDAEYQNNVFSNNTYENVMKHLVAWAAPGNHDYGQNPFNPSPAWLNIFDFPQNGECGGLASGTEKYFSWNYGNIHFLQLDCYGTDRDSAAAMATWLKNDLLQNTSAWTIAYWHHPPYTKGNHCSDNLTLADPELPHLRQHIVPILEKYGVDLVMNGHSHAYERSMLLNGHYGLSSTLNDSMIVDSTSGSYPADCAYLKDSIGGKGNKGTVYVVNGTGGVYSGVQPGWPHPVMYKYFSTELGSMLLEVHGNKLQASYINAFGIKLDSFTIVKNMKVRKTVYACKDSALTLFPSWHESAQWWPMSASGDSLLIFPYGDTTIVANDLINCLTDTIDVKVVPDSVCLQLVGEKEISMMPEMKLSPVPLEQGVVLNVSLNNFFANTKVQFVLTDLNGNEIRRISTEVKSGVSFSFYTHDLRRGIYVLSVISDKGVCSRKLIVL